MIEPDENTLLTLNICTESLAEMMKGMIQSPHSKSWKVVMGMLINNSAHYGRNNAKVTELIERVMNNMMN